MQFHKSPMAVALCGTFSLYSMAAQSAQLDPVVVTATRTAQTVDESLASVSVITRGDIERLQAQSLQDLLRGVNGISIANNGGLGKGTSLFMRGTESGHVLVLIDGVKVGSATLGTTAFEDIPVAQIERIEIVRGPRSSLYGSEAIGGVIQIFTRKGDGEYKPSFSTSAGSYGTYTTQAGVGGGNEQGWFNANVSNINSKGFNACKGSYSSGCFTIEPDRDSYHSQALSMRGGRRLAEGVTAEFNALRNEGNSRYDGWYNHSLTVQQAVGGKLNVNLSPMWQMSLAAGQSRDLSDNFGDSGYLGSINTRRNSASWQNDITVGNGRLVTVGLDRQLDYVDSTTAYTNDSRGNTALFTQYQGSVGSVDMDLSLRRDDSEQFGGHTTGGIAFGTALGQGLRGTLAYGTAFKAPTFNSLYWPSSNSTYSGITYISHGNPDLAPEESKTVELGLRYTFAGSNQLNISAYQTRITNLISWNTTTTGVNEYTSAPENVGEVNIRGVEGGISTQLAGWGVRMNITLLDPENQGDGANYGNVLPRRAKQSYRLDTDRDFGLYTLGASLRGEGRRYDNLSNSLEMGGYTTVDLRAGYDLSKTWQLQGRIENLLDKGYETAYVYNQPGRSLYVTLRYQP